MAKSESNFNKQLISITPDSVVDMYEIDFSNLQSNFEMLKDLHGVNLGADAIYRFCPMKNSSNPVYWQGNAYQPLPVKMESFESQSDGRLPRPTISIANPEGLLSKIIRSNKDFANCKVTRKRTFVKFLDDENFQNRNLNESGKNPFGESDPNSHFPDDIFFINKKTIENKNVITFELVSSLELQGSSVPARIVMPSHCSWMYRCSIGCGYKGLAIEDSEGRDLTQKYAHNNYGNGLEDIPKWSKHGFLDNELVPGGYDSGSLVKIIPQSSADPYKSTPVVFLCIKTHAIASDHIPFFDNNHWVKDECQKTIDSCKKRFSESHLDSLGGSRNITDYNKINITHKGLRFGGFPGTERYPAA